VELDIIKAQNDQLKKEKEDMLGKKLLN
jgi:hypothetical protein